MLSYISAKEAAEKWNISQRRVAVLCSESRIDGAMMVGKMWIIPGNATKPEDKRAAKYETKQVQLKPFIKWAGGKSQLVDRIKQLFQQESPGRLTKYAEPMVGGGALLFNILSLNIFEQVYICDINAELINAYNAVKYNADALIDKLNAMQLNFLPMDENGRKYYYYSIRDKFNNTLLNDDTCTDKAAYFIFLNKTCFNGLYRVNSKGKFNVPHGKYSNPRICDEETLRADSAVLQRVEILCGDFAQTGKYADDNVLYYFDPPYRPLTETSAFTSYAKDGFDDMEQMRLRDFCEQIAAHKSLFVASNSDPQNVDNGDDFFDLLYGMFSIKRVSASRMINSKGNGRGAISEIMISNVANAY